MALGARAVWLVRNSLLGHQIMPLTSRWRRHDPPRDSNLVEVTSIPV
jgi:hypothetical protein